jgi:2-haloalkanoic acid dehalogenase type II
MDVGRSVQQDKKESNIIYIIDMYSLTIILYSFTFESQKPPVQISSQKQQAKRNQVLDTIPQYHNTHTTMSKLTDFKLLSFDVYGTLIDWERGFLTAMQPALSASGKSDMDPKHILKTCGPLQAREQAAKPGQIYSSLLTSIHPTLCAELGLSPPSPKECRAVGASVASWPAFPDTVAALKRLQKHYKMVVLSNVDNASFAGNNKNSLDGFEWDAVLTAEDIGSYKPDLKNFEYMFGEAERRWGIKREEVLQTAQSQFHDHHPARSIGLKSCWIWRPESVLGNR